MTIARKYILILSFLMLPFGFLTFGIIHQGQHLAFVIAAMVIIGSLIKNDWIFSFFIYSTFWILFICIYRLFFPATPIQTCLTAMDMMIYFMAGAVIYVAVVKSKLKNETFYNIICIAALIQGTLALLQSFGFDPVVWTLNKVLTAVPLLDSRTMVGSLGNNNFLAAFIGISLPFFFRKNWFYGLILLIPILYFSRTTSAIVPVLIGSFVFFYPHMYKRFKIVAGVALLLAASWYAVFHHTPFYANPRWTLWYEAFRIWAVHWFPVVFGMGPGANWGHNYPMHNEWAEGLYQFGLIGVALMIGYVVTIYRGNRILFSAFIILAINMFGNYPIHLAPSAFLIIIICALIERERNVQRA